MVGTSKCLEWLGIIQFKVLGMNWNYTIQSSWNDLELYNDVVCHTGYPKSIVTTLKIAAPRNIMKLEPQKNLSVEPSNM